MGWYEIARDMHDDPDGSGGRTLGTIQITSRLIYTALALVALFAANHIIRLQSGAASWFGYQQILVKELPDWAPRAPQLIPSRQSWGEHFGAAMPMPAQIGQEVVVHYDLKAKSRPDVPGQIPAAVIYVRCGIGCRNWQARRITEGGSGEFVVPVEDPDFYSFEVRQYPNADGSPSEGTYWLGVRKIQSQ